MRRLVILAAALALLLSGVTPSARQASSGNVPRLNGRPNMTGLWQSLTTANWDIQDHNAKAGPFFQLGAAGAAPPGQGIVEGNEIPYLPAAAARKKENAANWLKMDPEIKCYFPGVPRATYMPYPFQIVQSDRDILIAYAYASANRLIHMDKHRPAPVDSWMGWSNGTWQGDTLAVDVTGMNGQSWFDRAGNFASENLHVVERYTMNGPNHITYEATIEDPTVFSRPWKISLPLYRRMERNVQMVDFQCVEFAEELIYGHLTKQ